MADQEISIQKLLEMARDGHKIQLGERQTIVAKIQKVAPDTGPTTIAQFDELITKLNELVESNKYRIEADRERFAAQVELLAVLQRLTKTAAVSAAKPHPTINLDLEPLKAVLREIQKNSIPKPVSSPEPTPLVSELRIERTQQGFLDKVIPVYGEPTKYKN